MIMATSSILVSELLLGAVVLQDSSCPPSPPCQIYQLDVSFTPNTLSHYFSLIHCPALQGPNNIAAIINPSITLMPICQTQHSSCRVKPANPTCGRLIPSLRSSIEW